MQSRYKQDTRNTTALHRKSIIPRHTKSESLGAETSGLNTKEYKNLSKRVAKLEIETDDYFKQIFCALKILIKSKSKYKIGFKIK